MNSPERGTFIETFALPMGLAMLGLWVLGMVLIDGAPGWLHFLLTFGVFFVIWGIVVREKGSPQK